MRATLILALVFSLIGESGFSQSFQDTIYYDKNWKGCMNSSTASFFRVISISEDPNYPKRFRDYNIEGVILKEGCFKYIDKYDASKSIFDGSYYSYNNGVLDYEMTYKDGKLTGPFKYFFPDGKVWREGTYKEGLVDGKFFEYHNNGRKSKELEYKESIANGLYRAYDENGHVVSTCRYKNGLLVGQYENITTSGITKKFYREITPASPYELGFSIAAYHNEYATRKTVLTVDKQKVMVKDRSSQLVEFNIIFYNMSSEEVPILISDVEIKFNYDKKKKKESLNMALGESTAVELVRDWAQRVVESEYDRARSIAKSAATKTSNSSGHSSEYLYANGSSSSNARANGFANLFGLFGGSAKATATVSSQANSKDNINGFSGSSSSSNTTTRDGLLEYEIYQKEMERAQSIENNANDYIISRAAEYSYSNFVIYPYEFISKIIVASDFKEEYDSVILNFKLNGKPFSLKWTSEELQY